jgi:hypothetical protein
MGMRFPNQVRDPEAEERSRLVQEEIAKKRMQMLDSVQQEQGVRGSNPLLQKAMGSVFDTVRNFDPREVMPASQEEAYDRMRMMDSLQQRETGRGNPLFQQVVGNVGESLINAGKTAYDAVRNFTPPKEGIIPRDMRGRGVPLGTHGVGLGISDYFMRNDEPDLPEGWHAPMALPKQEPVYRAHARRAPPAQPLPGSMPQQSSQPRRPVAPRAAPSMAFPEGGFGLQQDYGTEEDLGLDPWDLNLDGYESDATYPQGGDYGVDISPQAYADEGFGDSPMPGMDFDPESPEFNGEDPYSDDLSPIFNEREKAMYEFAKSGARGPGPSQIPYMNLLMNSAAQAGSIGGKVADTKGYNQYSDSLMKEEDQREKRRSEVQKYLMDKKSSSKDMAFEREKLKQQGEIANKKLVLQGQGQKERLAYLMAMLGQKGDIESRKLSAELEKIGSDAFLKKYGIDKDANNDTKRIGIDEDRLKETSRHNKAVEDIQKTNAETAATKAKNAAKAKAKGVTDSARKTKMFADRMKQAMDGYDRLIGSSGYDPTNAQDRLLSNTGKLGSSFKSSNGKLASQYEVEFVRAKLRDESGASIGLDEATKEADAYFPRYGDTPQVLAQKKRARQIAVQSMMGEYEKEMQPVRELEAEHGSLEDDASGGQVRVQWKGKIKVIPAARLQEALKAGAKEVK